MGGSESVMVAGERRWVVVFDLDGTLVDTSQDLTFSVNHLRATHGRPPLSTDEVLRAVGHGVGHLVATTLELDPHDKERLAAPLAAYREHYRRHQGERSIPYAGIVPALEALSLRADLYVLSNKPHEGTVRQVAISGLTRFFKGVYGGGAFSALKPHPAGILAAMAQSGADPRLVAMVGDMDVDLATARAAGVAAVFASWGFSSADKLSIPADVLVPTPAHLLDSLARWFGRSTEE